MERVKSSICVPKGFVAAGTYSGICSTRVKLDLAMIVSRSDCSIVMVEGKEEEMCTGRAVLYHNGLALPKGKRGQEIKKQALSSVAARTNIPAEAVTFVVTGQDGQYFRPSLIVNSMSTLTAALSSGHDQQVETVMDNGGRTASHTLAISVGAATCAVGAIYAGGTDTMPGRCLVTTDMAAAPEQVLQALSQCGAALPDCAVTVMANGMAGAHTGDVVTLLSAAMQRLFGQMGISPALQQCC